MAMTFDTNGSLYFRPNDSGTYNLGDSNYGWRKLYITDSNSTIQELNNVETWTFTLSDGTTTTKKILVG